MILYKLSKKTSTYDLVSYLNNRVEHLYGDLDTLSFGVDEDDCMVVVEGDSAFDALHTNVDIIQFNNEQVDIDDTNLEKVFMFAASDGSSVSVVDKNRMTIEEIIDNSMIDLL